MRWYHPPSSRAFLIGFDPVGSVPVLPQLHTRPWSLKRPKNKPASNALLLLLGFLHSRLHPSSTHGDNSSSSSKQQPGYRLGDEGGGGGGLVAPGGGQDTDGLVVAGQTVDTGLDQNEAELGVLVLAVTLEVLADGDGLDGTQL